MHSYKVSQNFFIQSSALQTSWLFSMILNNDIVETEEPGGICSLIFFVYEFTGLF